MMTALNSIGTRQAPRPLRTVAIVNSQTRLGLLDAVLDVPGNDIVFVAQASDAYSHVKRLTPDLVVVFLSGDDPDGCRVLSMLALDSATSRIPVVTYATWPSEGVSDEADGLDEFRQTAFHSLN